MSTTLITLLLISTSLCLQETSTPTIYIAGDSTVKTYADDQFIAGWGQYLSYFLSSDVPVVNAAQGGRSSRSFINENRLYAIENDPYKFGENGGNPIMSTIKKGDYLFFQFGHNDDSSYLPKSYRTLVDRMVPVGTAVNGVYPTTEGIKSKTNVLPKDYTDYATEAEKVEALAMIAKYGDEYYVYDKEKGTYKWYLKEYIRLAREKGAIPVIVTPVTRKVMKNGKIVGGAGHFGENFAYVEAARQLAKEENCLLVDLFDKTVKMHEIIQEYYADYLHALIPGTLTGEWPDGFENAFNNEKAGCTGLDGTHYNKFGAFITAAFVAETILSERDLKLSNGEMWSFVDKVVNEPKSVIENPGIPESSLQSVYALFNYINFQN